MKIFNKIKDFVLDTLFPIACIFCNRDDVWLCDNCLQKINFLSFQVCPQCEKTITQDGRICQPCKSFYLSQKLGFPPLDALLVTTKYKENNISALVHRYKYNFIEDFSVPLGKILTKALLQSNLPLFDFIVPVPLHPRRLRWRGFNQSELLANYVAQNLAPGFPIPVFSDLLIRKRYTSAQMKIRNYSERRKNMENAFEINKKAWASDAQNCSDFIKNKKILLVDDIATTGSTLFECAKILKQNGAGKVFSAVIARQEID